MTPPAKAEAARKELFGMAKEHFVEVADAVIATADEDRNVKLDQMVNIWTIGATGGAFWGLLAGLIFFNPLLGMAGGAGAGALSGGLSDHGIDDHFMKDVSSALQPGQAVLCQPNARVHYLWRAVDYEGETSSHSSDSAATTFANFHKDGNIRPSLQAI